MEILPFYATLALLALLLLAVVVAVVYVVGTLVGFGARVLAARHPSKEKIVHRTTLTTCAVLGSLVAYTVYVAVFPDDDFYFGEFTTATLRSVPLGVVVEDKSASYPDFHGDYCSHSRMLLTEEAYQALLNELTADPRFLSKEVQYSSTGPSNSPPAMLFVKEFKRKDLKIDHHHSVRFASDRRHLEVHICVV
jgi:hypothetical protein